MRILIIGTGKCGSNTLAQAMADSLNLELINEPWHPTLGSEEKADRAFTAPNVIVKCINGAWQHPWRKTPDEHQHEDWKTRNEFFEDFSTYFDKTILVDRKDEVKRLFSVMHAHKHDTWHWNGKYTPQEFTVSEEDLHLLYGVFHGKYSIGNISDMINEPIFFLEELCNEDYETSKNTYFRIFENSKIAQALRKNRYPDLYERYFNPKNSQRNS